MEQSQKELNDLQDIVFSLEKSFQDKEADALSEFQSLRDEIKTKVGYFSLLYLKWECYMWCDNIYSKNRINWQGTTTNLKGENRVVIGLIRYWIILFRNS